MYQVDAFASQVFEGNPAAVCPLTAWLDDALMQAIAEENNLSETAFFVADGEDFQLRWFTPKREVDLCGHATLATAHALYAHLGFSRPEVVFHTRSGALTVARQGDALVMDFPAIPAQSCPAPSALVEGLGCPPLDVLAADDYLVVLEDPEQVRRLTPDMAALSLLDRRGVCVTAPGGKGSDFVSRFFAPKYGIPEDPVTGSAHCMLAPYWAARLGKARFRARQVSARGGDVQCELRGERVLLSGRAVTYMVAEVGLP
jgi:PhzF family phenazine biosynthesis protein